MNKKTWSGFDGTNFPCPRAPESTMQEIRATAGVLT